MKIHNLRDILAKLSRELQRAEDVDADARREMQELHRHVDRLEQAHGTEVDTFLDQIKALESRFAAEHPTVARVARELADAVAKMGI